MFGILESFNLSAYFEFQRSVLFLFFRINQKDFFFRVRERERLLFQPAMEFCPTCGNMLQYELPHMGRAARFFCPTCPYVCYLENRVIYMLLLYMSLTHLINSLWYNVEAMIYVLWTIHELMRIGFCVFCRLR